MSVLGPELEFGGVVKVVDDATRTLQPLGTVKGWLKWAREHPGAAALIGTVPFWGPAVAATLGPQVAAAAKSVGAAAGL